MAKNLATHAFSLGEKPTLDIDDHCWRQIERAYGSPLPPLVRAGVVRATEALMFLHAFERTPARMAKVKVILEAHDQAASRFFNELFTGPSVTSDSGAYAHYLIENNFKSSQTSVTELALDGLLDALRAFHIACNTSIKQLSDPCSSNTRRGDAWKKWINRLTEVLSQVEKSASVRSDDGCSQQVHLLSLVRELQSFLPPDCRHDEAALAGAISDALVCKR